jgi:hypothetical protein
MIHCLKYRCRYVSIYIRKNAKIQGKQNYLCVACSPRLTTIQTNWGYSEDIKPLCFLLDIILGYPTNSGGGGSSHDNYHLTELNK